MTLNTKFLGVSLLFLSTVILHLGKVLVFYLYGIDKIVESSTVLLTNLDFIITILLLSLFFAFNSERIYKLKMYYFSFNISFAKIQVLKLFGFLGVCVLLFYAKESLALILKGVGRQEAVDILGRSSILKVLFGKFFVYSVVFVCLLNVDKITKLIFITGFLLSVVSFSSRSDVAVVFFIFFIVNMVNFNLTAFFKVLKYTVIVIVSVLFITLFIQNRQLESQFMGPFKPIEDFFLYGSYSMVLSERAIEFSESGEKYIFPFIGYLTEFFIVKLGSTNNTVDSDFISQFVLFYSDVRQHAANVSYPWWSWFYGSYSYLGVFVLKPIFILFLYYLTVRFKLYTFFIYFTYWFMFSSFNKFPLISIEGYITLISLAFLEFLLRVKVGYKVLK
ncbi:hypothetical protein [Pseudoalteromonas gelatinilytica]|uniref:Oligosaccharide repeat unit polymerase n=1 Tax=Pseudoalteromonas gelatinilytica TaxID=1703256 RepID=A0A3A3F752_9GAMM|nr:hypothetical protein [Pseudoalteromonas profundi]RJF37998.1 hypothetical protein D4741_08030 [Pseudoalteromonas profundi]